MAEREKKTLSQRIEKVRSRLDSWRKTRSGGRIPEPLWESAVELARVHGTSPVARSLRLDYNGLKRRLDASRPSLSAATQGVPPGFVEVELPTVARAAGCTLRLEDRSGSRLTIDLGGRSVGDIAEIAKALWRRRP